MTSSAEIIQKRKLSLIGVGRLGLCLGLSFAKAGWDVLGSDIFPSYVDAINARTLKSPEPGVESSLRACTKLRATLDLDEVVEHSDLIMILVATPTGIGEHAYDCGVLSKVLSELADRRIKNKHVVICCTVLPGYISNVASYLIEGCEGCTLSYNPEFIAQGDIMRGLERPDLVLIGEGSKDAGDVLQMMYEGASENEPAICRMSAQSAEIMKLSLNCFVTTKISFSNMIGAIADATPGADKYAILEAIGRDTRVGNKCLRPGFGYGGPCFPRDNRALGTYAHSVGVEPAICEATDRINVLHASYMAKALLDQGLDHYVISDVAYKPKCPVDIIEESQPLEVAKLLVKAGKHVTIKDRSAIVELVRRTYGRLFSYEVTNNGHPGKANTAWGGNPASSYVR